MQLIATDCINEKRTTETKTLKYIVSQINSVSKNAKSMATDETPLDALQKFGMNENVFDLIVIKKTYKIKNIVQIDFSGS